MKPLLMLGLVVCSLFRYVSLAQTTAKPKQPKAELRLRVILEKETYAVNERVFTRIEFTNLTDMTLCFPEPAQGYEDPVVGDLTVVGYGPNGRDRNHFMKHLDGSMPDDEQLLLRIEKTWTKLAPNQTHVSESAPSTFDVDAPGEWVFRGSYVAPVAPFDPKGSKVRLRALAEKVGCTPPSLDAVAPPIKLQVVSATHN